MLFGEVFLLLLPLIPSSFRNGYLLLQVSVELFFGLLVLVRASTTAADPGIGGRHFAT